MWHDSSLAGGERSVLVLHPRWKTVLRLCTRHRPIVKLVVRCLRQIEAAEAPALRAAFASATARPLG